MKKFIYFLIIPIFVLFNDRVFADTVIPEFVENKIGYYLVCNTNNCYLDTSTSRSVFIYETDSQLHDYEFKYLSGGSSPRISVGVTDTLPIFNFNGYQGDVALKVLYETSPVIGNSYTFSTDKHYILMTLSFSVIDNDYGSVEWLGSSVEPEPIPPYEYEFKGLIYVPEDDIYNKCYVVQNENVIRGYDVIPTLSTSYNYRDYYINSSYIYKDGSGQWSQYSVLPVCLDSDILTNNLYYRLDFDKSLIIFFIISIFSIYLPIKLFSKIFRKGVL